MRDSVAGSRAPRELGALQGALLSVWLLTQACSTEGKQQAPAVAPTKAPTVAKADPLDQEAAPVDDADRADELPALVPSVAVDDKPGECSTGDGCYAAGVAQERERAIKRAADLYERGCDLGDGLSCNRLGELHRDGKGVKPDDAQARSLFERGCQLGSSSACDALGH